ncbi:proteasome subunit beta [Egicoccus halophilus]|uniref:Proteasome subunit beta n=1 Tax=Egicoccus halophilus TaxID=1670830 RepID=A0A8J3A6N4_9ACTN|nr:proteasome subunit beta [Egicoccus halophilus]GGI04679.1 proteasome subunit beta [Egicoccus halophilus]
MTFRAEELLAGLPSPFDARSSSFFETLRRQAPDAVPPVFAGGPMAEELRGRLVDGTTVLAVRAADGVVIAGDRRATAGNLISRGDMRKIFPADDWSAVGISGTAGPAMELARIFATELEHYEKVEGDPLSLEGKSNKLAGLVRAHLPMAMQGLIVVPLFAGVDPRTGEGRIYEYDPVGGRYRATSHAATGSGSLAARATLKRLVTAGSDLRTAASVAVEALFDAAEEDSATGGPDLIRSIYPIVASIDAEGYRELTDEQVAAHVEDTVERRRNR